MEWRGTWKVQCDDWFELRNVPGEIIAESPLGTVTLRKTVGTTSDFSGAVSGVAVAVELQARGEAAGVKTFRCYFKVRPDLMTPMMLPGVIEDPELGSMATAFLPLVMGERHVDVFFLKEGPYLILESQDPDLTLATFRTLSGGVRSFLSYLTGQRLDGESCDVVRLSRCSGLPVESGGSTSTAPFRASMASGLRRSVS